MSTLTRNSSEVVELIQLQKRLMDEPSLPLELRTVFKRNLVLISTLDNQLKRYVDNSTIGKIRELYTQKDEFVDNGLVKIIEDTQSFLSKNHTDDFTLSDQDSTSYSSTVKAIRNYVIKNSIRHDDFKNQDDLVKFLEIEILGLSVLEEAFNGEISEKIEEIQVNDYNDIRFIIDGKEQRTDLSFRSPEHQKLLVDRIARLAGLTGQSENLTDTKPFVRWRLGDTTRISAMGSPIARRPNGSVKGNTYQLAIRKQKSKPFDRNFLLSKGSINEYGDTLIETLVKYGVSINAYGGTGTGKTAMLRRYLVALPDDRRIITMAEIDEMNLRNIDLREYIVVNGEKKKNKEYRRAINSALMWECTNPNTEITGGLKGFSGMVNASLTFTPETIVLQESKGGEIKDVIETAISGHQVFTTIHANSPEAFFLRILLMYQLAAANISDSLILKQIPLAFPVIMNFKRYPDGSRKIAELTELIGFDATTQQPITRTLLKYVVKSNYIDENDKLVMTGEFFANKKGFLSERLKTILRDGGIPDKVLQDLELLYNNAPQMDFNDAV